MGICCWASVSALALMRSRAACNSSAGRAGVCGVCAMAVAETTTAASWRRVSFIRISLVQYFLNTVSCPAGNRSLTVAARIGARVRNHGLARIPLLMFQRFHGRLLHYRPRRGISRQDFELLPRLLDKHIDPRPHRAPLLARPLHQRRLHRVVHHVEYHFSGNIAVEEALVHVRIHPQWSGVHHRIEMARIELLAHERFGAMSTVCALSPKSAAPKRSCA